MKSVPFHPKHPLVTALPAPIGGAEEISRLGDAVAARISASAARAVAARGEAAAAAVAAVFLENFEKRSEIAPQKQQVDLPSKFGKKRKTLDS